MRSAPILGLFSPLALSAILCSVTALAQSETVPVDMSVESAPEFDGTIARQPGAERVEERVAAGKTISQRAFAQGFTGEILVDMGDLLLLNAVSPDLAREGYGTVDGDTVRWPFASITKQKVAARIADELDAGGYSLDTPISEFVPGLGKDGVPVPTMRQLLQHRSGLRNPNDTPMGANGWNAFYNKPDEYGLEWCVKGRSSPPETGWSYNNCDYIVLGAAFEELSFENWQYMLGIGSLDAGGGNQNLVRHIVITKDNVDTFFRMAAPEANVLPNYEAAGALGGGLSDIVFENWSMMRGYEEAIEHSGAKAEFWKGDPKLGYMALGHWVFTVQPEQCDAPVLVSQRKGEIGRYQLENIMLPELKRSMVFATTQAGAFEFGEIWTQQGFLYEAVGTLACGDRM
ncbi:MAG: serine hydrolase domain-containing protein [Pseudomonadota bacterium]